MTRPDFSAIIPTFNAERWVGDAIRSVLAQTGPSVECIVVDDGSTDSTAEVVHRFGNDIKYIQQERSGVSAARNRGAKAAAAHYLAFLDADDVWLPGKLEQQKDALGLSPEACLCYGGYKIADEQLQVRESVAAPEPAVALRRVLLLEHPAPWISSTGVVRADVFMELGGFDESLSTSADADLLVALLVHGRATRVEGPVALYRQHGGQMHLNTVAFEHDMPVLIDKAFSSGLLPGDLSGRRGSAISSFNAYLGAFALSEGNYSRSVRYFTRAFTADFLHTVDLLSRGLARRARRYRARIGARQHTTPTSYN